MKPGEGTRDPGRRVSGRAPNDRDTRRAAALRSNLHRRKAQARGRTAAGAEHDDETVPGPETDAAAK